MEAMKDQIDAAVAEMANHLDTAYPNARQQHQAKVVSESEKNREKAQEFCGKMNADAKKHGDKWYVTDDGKVARRAIVKAEGTE
jgi:hypothetical protein